MRLVSQEKLIIVGGGVGVGGVGVVVAVNAVEAPVMREIRMVVVLKQMRDVGYYLYHIKVVDKYVNLMK